MLVFGRYPLLIDRKLLIDLLNDVAELVVFQLKLATILCELVIFVLDDIQEPLDC
jgi:hypothetical protein